MRKEVMDLQHQKKHKTLKIMISVALAMGLIAAVAIAISSKLFKTATNNFYPAEVVIAVEENGKNNAKPTITVSLTMTDPDPDGDELSVDKLVDILNVNQNAVNNTRSWVRVCLMPQLMKTNTTKDAAGTGIKVDVVIGSEGFDYLDAANIMPQLQATDSYKMNGISFHLVDGWENDWEYGEDGYFYYKKVLEPGEKTSPLLEKVTMEKSYKQTLAAGTWLRVTVSADAIQADGNEMKNPSDRWR